MLSHACTDLRSFCHYQLSSPAAYTKTSLLTLNGDGERMGDGDEIRLTSRSGIIYAWSKFLKNNHPATNHTRSYRHRSFLIARIRINMSTFQEDSLLHNLLINSLHSYSLCVFEFIFQLANPCSLVVVSVIK